MNEPLPNGWVYARLDQIATVVAGNPAPQGPEYFNGGKFNFVRVHDMGVNGNNTFLTKTRDLINEAATEKMRQIPANSVLFTKSGASTLLNQRAILAKDSYVVSHIAAASPSKGVESKWLFYFLKLVDFATLAHATNMPSLPLSRAKAIMVPVAPYGEQARIVAKIEELFSELDKGIESLKAARAKHNVYRQSVLKHAFNGKLTAKWRVKNKDKLETPEQLLACIKREREARYDEQIQEWNTAIMAWEAEGKQGKKPSKPRKPLTPDKPRSDQFDKMWKVSPTWQWLQVGHFAFVTKLAGFEYTEFVDYDDDGDLPVIKAENAGLDGFRTTSYSRVKSESVKHLTRSYLNGNEVLMVFVGAGTGNVATVPRDQVYFLGPNIGMIRPETQSIMPRYVELFLRSPMGKQLALASVKAVTHPSLSMGTIRQIPVILPSTEEQSEVVHQLDNILSTINTIEGEIESQLLKADALRQSILKRAFSGQLVPQDPDDEPASFLLERIKEEKAARSPINTRAKRRR